MVSTGHSTTHSVQSKNVPEKLEISSYVLVWVSRTLGNRGFHRFLRCLWFTSSIIKKVWRLRASSARAWAYWKRRMQWSRWRIKTTTCYKRSKTPIWWQVNVNWGRFDEEISGKVKNSHYPLRNVQLTHQKERLPRWIHETENERTRGNQQC